MLRQWIDEPRPMGLPPEAENVVILLFAEQTNRSFFLHGGPFDAALNQLPDALELREQRLPPPEQWQVAVARAGRIFGAEPLSLLNGSNVAKLATEVKEKAQQSRSACQSYCQRLRERCQALGIDPLAADRWNTATATLALVERVHDVALDEVVNALATAEVATTETAMGACWSHVAELSGRLDTTNWEIFEAVSRLTDERQVVADEIGEQMRQALTSDEHVEALGTALKAAQSRAVRVLSQSPERSRDQAPDPTPAQAGELSQSGPHIVAQGVKQHLDLETAKALLAELERERQDGQEIRLHMSWVIEAHGAES
jgi:hypothetical protein